MSDIHVGKRGSEAAGEEQPDKLRKTVRFEQESPSAAASSDPTVALEYPASGHKIHANTFLRWMHPARWMDEKESPHRRSVGAVSRR